MNINFLKDTVVWGFGLWFIGYVFSILLFAFVPTNMIGWIITPIGVLIAIWVLLKKIQNMSIRYYVWLGIVWALIAVVCDYLFLVKLFNPADGYYKLDVYLYYLITLVLPSIVGWFKVKTTDKTHEQHI